MQSSDLVGGGAVLIMPKFAANDADVGAKAGAATVNVSNVAAFYTALELDHTDMGFDTATLITTGDTTEQTIVDTGTGVSGVLTQILTSALSGAGTMTVRVTIDGTTTTFVGTIPAATFDVMLVGDFVPWAATTTAAQYGAINNAGYSVLNDQKFAMLTPKDSATRGLPIGMIFEDSMKVTIQGSVSLRTGSATHKAAAAWLNYIPEGLI